MGPFSPDSLKPRQAALLNLIARQSEEAQMKQKGQQAEAEFGVGPQFYEI